MSKHEQTMGDTIKGLILMFIGQSAYKFIWSIFVW